MFRKYIQQFLAVTYVHSLILFLLIFFFLQVLGGAEPSQANKDKVLPGEVNN